MPKDLLRLLVDGIASNDLLILCDLRLQHHPESVQILDVLDLDLVEMQPRQFRQLTVQESFRIGWKRVDRLVDQSVELEPIAAIDTDRLAVQLSIEFAQQIRAEKPRLLLEVPFAVIDLARRPT